MNNAGQPAGIKLSKGAISGNVFIVGRPDLADETSVTEGVADAIPIAARQPGTAICTLGTGGMLAAGRPGLAQWLAAAPAVTIWADRDDGKRGRAPAGLQAARKLQHYIQEAGGVAQVCHAAPPHKDPAEAAARAGFPALHPEFAGCARVLAERNPGWPRWCAAQTADLETRDRSVAR